VDKGTHRKRRDRAQARHRGSARHRNRNGRKQRKTRHDAQPRAAQLLRAAIAVFATVFGTAAAAAASDHTALRACRTRLAAAAAANATQRLLQANFEAAPRHLAATALAVWHVRIEAHFAATLKHAALYRDAAQAVQDIAAAKQPKATPAATMQTQMQMHPAPALALLAATVACSVADTACVLQLQVYPTAALLFPAYGNQVANAAIVLTVASVANKHARHAHVAAQATRVMELHAARKK
jgi:hypothetical protein